MLPAHFAAPGRLGPPESLDGIFRMRRPRSALMRINCIVFCAGEGLDPAAQCQPWRGASTMTAMPVRAKAAPTQSHTVGRMPSITHNHMSAVAIYTPP